MAAGRTSTTWKKGENPTVKKGQKQKATLLKESLGLTNWDKLASFIKNEGAEKLVNELMNLDGKDFINSYSTLAEFVKPKLQRTTIEGDEKNPIVVKNSLSDLPTDLKKQILDHIRRNNT